MLDLYHLVSERFTHGNSAYHNFFSNWLMAMLDTINPAFKHIHVPEMMVRRGYSFLFLQLAMDNGIRERHVGLNGHVVMQAWHEGDWYLFDPDLEVIPRDGDGEVLSVEEMAQNPHLLQKYCGYHQGENACMVEILGSREDNTNMSYPPGAWFEWKSNVLYWFEMLAAYLKFILPLGLLGLGVWLLRGDFKRLSGRGVADVRHNRILG